MYEKVKLIFGPNKNERDLIVKELTKCINKEDIFWLDGTIKNVHYKSYLLDGLQNKKLLVIENLNAWRPIQYFIYQSTGELHVEGKDGLMTSVNVKIIMTLDEKFKQTQFTKQDPSFLRRCEFIEIHKF